LGATAGTAIRRVSTAGSIDSSWSGDGQLLPGEINPSASRFDTLDIDPYGPALGIGVFGSSNIRRNDLETGAALTATGAIGNLPTNGVNTRDIAFRPDGGVYVRYNTAAAQAHQASTSRRETPTVASETLLLSLGGARAHYSKPSSPTSP
jgi:hypothetical protein